MRVAALYDIHGNGPALDAVLAEAEVAGADVVVAGGDVAGGPMPAAALDRLSDLGDRVRWVRGNGERELVAMYDAGARPEDAPHPFAALEAWAAGRLERRHRDLMASFPATVALDVDGLGRVRFCHATPRSDEELITAFTPDARLEAALAGVQERVVVAGHTHRQLDRSVGGIRFVNAGSVGLPYEGRRGAYWLLLGPGVELRRTEYDVPAALAAFRATGAPALDDESFRESLEAPGDADAVARMFEAQAADLSS